MNYIFFISVIAVVMAVLGIAAFTNFRLDNEHYDRLKWVVIRWSFIVTFIGLLVKTFDIPNGVETVTVVAGLGAMLAGLLNISHNAYEHNVSQMADEDLGENQAMMAEDMLEEDEAQQISEEA